MISLRTPASRPSESASTSHPVRQRRLWMGVATILAMVIAGQSAPAAFASSISAATFSGGAGTASVAGTLYAKSGATVTLTVSTSSDTKCVVVGGSMSSTQTSATAKSSWTFTTTASGTDGARAVTAVASTNFNSNSNCTGNRSDSTQASYTVDNTGPAVVASLSPAANAADWNKADTTVTWTATDAGSGVASGPTPASTNVTANGVVTRTSTATDRVGNATEGSVTVRVDKAAPTITAAQVKNADGTTTVTFTCADSSSGGAQSSGIASCVADGETTNSKTVAPGVTVNGTATDAAGNTAKASSTAPAADNTPPVLSGSPTSSPNGAGWYSGDVTIDWTASDPESGIPMAPADTTITGEGSGLTSSTTVKNGAGLSTTATSSPAVNIDRTAPTTGISGTSNAWVNGAVTVELAASDNLSGVARTEYTVDGGSTQTGTTFTLSTEGEHEITFRSVDKAGNTEATQTATVKIDQTAPTISHDFTPLAYT
ncbi:MAG TPA: hypothetical protein VEX88_08205, partial [Glaciibacter sp.]|nr:hypothetical protein [Glaciibacter sp.]